MNPFLDRDWPSDMNICAALTRHDPRDKCTDYFAGKNLITDAGLLFYVQELAGTTHTGSVSIDSFYSNTSGGLQNPSSAPTPANDDTYSDFTNLVSGSLTSVIRALPSTDTNNSGRGNLAVTYKMSYTTSQIAQGSADNTIKGGAIWQGATAGAAPSGGTSALLTHWVFSTPFRKTNTDSLDVWVNHTLGRA